MSAAGRDVTSSADTLRQLLADHDSDDGRWVWIEKHGEAVLALLDAAQRMTEAGGMPLPPDYTYLAAAVRALSEPRP